MPEKQCRRCGTTKSVIEFGRNAARPDGRADYCKPCTKQYRRDRQRVLADPSYRPSTSATATAKLRAERARARRQIVGLVAKVAKINHTLRTKN